MRKISQKFLDPFNFIESRNSLCEGGSVLISKILDLFADGGDDISHSYQRERADWYRVRKLPWNLLPAACCHPYSTWNDSNYHLESHATILHSIGGYCLNELLMVFGVLLTTLESI